MPTTVKNVAKYILEKHGAMTHMKLQKLCYYSQAWSLVWDEKPIFAEHIEAWANGPVAPALYDCLRGTFTVTSDNLPSEDTNALDDAEKETVDAILEHYGDRTSQWLSDLTHMEQPWKAARVGLAAGERGDRVISNASMAEYYSSL